MKGNVRSYGKLEIKGWIITLLLVCFSVLFFTGVTHASVLLLRFKTSDTVTLSVNVYASGLENIKGVLTSDSGVATSFQGSGEFKFTDTGLTKGNTYKYTLETYYFSENEEDWVIAGTKELSVTTGAVSGYLQEESMTWGPSQTWEIDTVIIYENVTLTILPGTVVNKASGGGIIDLEDAGESKVIINGANLKDLFISNNGSNYGGDGIVSIKDAALENTVVVTGALEAFENNTVSCTSQSGWGVSHIMSFNIPVMDSISITGNTVEGCSIILKYVNEASSITINNNTLDDLWLSSGLAGTPGPAKSISITDNTVSGQIYFYGFGGALNIEGNNIASIKMDSFDAVAQTMIENNILTLQSGYFIIDSENVSGLIIKDNQVTCADSTGSGGNSWGVHAKNASNAVINGNTFNHCTYAIDVAGDNHTIQGNTISGGDVNAAFDRGLLKLTGNESKILDNSIDCKEYQAKEYGIMLENAVNNEISGNKIENCYGGFFLAGYNPVQDNIFKITRFLLRTPLCSLRVL